ncbi:MAG: NupC/NupG family nucleoside CNT transporter [Planctomycetes bacterium]|nr:NupC/NupG family nucleoside CNT transporter [Planctomycetota bacterium]
MLRLVSVLGVVALLGLCVALSRDRRSISWRTVGMGLLILFTVAAVFLYWTPGNQALQGFGQKVEGFLRLSMRGTSFVFNALADPVGLGRVFGPEKGFLFAAQVLPTLIFFASFMAVLYHLGVMQAVVRGMAAVMVRLLRTSGSESLSACANIFVGQTEAPLLVKPFLARMTRSEIHAIMTGGYATIAGGVFALYVGFGVDAGHLMVASVMGAPAGLLVSKLLWPETETSETYGTVRVVAPRTAGNVVEAAANGAIDGLHLALNVAAMLIAFLGLVAVLDAALGLVGGWTGYPGLDLGRVLGVIFYPVAAVLGVRGADVLPLAELLGTKLALTELVAYQKLSGMQAELDPRTVRIASFALCGFANFGSVAIQIGGLSAMAPERRPDIARLALRAMFAGAIATCLTAAIAGVVSDV